MHPDHWHFTTTVQELQLIFENVKIWLTVDRRAATFRRFCAHRLRFRGFNHGVNLFLYGYTMVSTRINKLIFPVVFLQFADFVMKCF